MPSAGVKSPLNTNERRNSGRWNVSQKTVTLLLLNRISRVLFDKLKENRKIRNELVHKPDKSKNPNQSKVAYLLGMALWTLEKLADGDPALGMLTNVKLSHPGEVVLTQPR